MDATTSGGSADIDSFVYRLTGGSTDATQSPAVPFGSYLTSGATHYGNDVSVEVKACRQYPELLLCSASWSAPIHLGRAVSIQLSGLAAIQTTPPQLLPPTPGAGYWVWTGQPLPAAGGAPGYDSVTIECGANDDPATPTQCEVIGGGLTGTDYPGLTVAVSANGAIYTRTYNWADTPH